MEAEIQNIVCQKHSAIRKNAKKKYEKMRKMVHTNTKSSNGQCRTVLEKEN